MQDDKKDTQAPFFMETTENLVRMVEEGIKKREMYLEKLNELNAVFMKMQNDLKETTLKMKLWKEGCLLLIVTNLVTLLAVIALILF